MYRVRREKKEQVAKIVIDPWLREPRGQPLSTRPEIMLGRASYGFVLVSPYISSSYLFSCPLGYEQSEPSSESSTFSKDATTFLRSRVN